MWSLLHLEQEYEKLDFNQLFVQLIDNTFNKVIISRKNRDNKLGHNNVLKINSCI